MGYWVDTKDPYITLKINIESVWWILKQAFNKGLVYKGYTIQPYSPMAGTGLSSHELNQPGCYRDVKDTSVTAQFLFVSEKTLFHSKRPFWLGRLPWTLPSNTALCVNKNVQYVLVETLNQYTKKPIAVVLAEKLVPRFF